ncbi:MAG: ATP-binding cassette domain-containing protein [Dorea sp.]|jgi:NHLM bacteriocin system ABC transporter ATP-binding protein|nr:ATP-binding cassette domain-containing protein [Dorea sp.]
MEMLDWFEEQIELRKKKDEELFQEAFADLASAAQGEKVLAKMLLSDTKKTTNTIEQILRFYRLEPGKIQIQAESFDEQLAEQLRNLGVMRRDVRLRPDWYRHTIGALIGFTKEGEPAALLPKRNGYIYFDYNKGKWKKINRRSSLFFSDQAVCLYKPLPMKPVSGWGFMKFCGGALDTYDYLRLVKAFLLVSLIGLANPYVTQKIFEEILPQNDRLMLAAAAIVLAGTVVSGMLFTVVRSLLISRSSAKMSITVDAALMARTVSLPTEFFKEYNAGELTSRIDSVSDAVKDMMDVVVSIGLTTMCSLIYIVQIRYIASRLLMPTLLILSLIFAVNAAAVWYQVGWNEKKILTRSKTSGVEYALYSGVQKLKLAGAERRAFANWAKIYKENVRASYQIPIPVRIVPSITAFLVYAGWALIYLTAKDARISAAEFMAYSSAYQLVMGAFLDCSRETGTFSEILAAFRMADPILKAVPEAYGSKDYVKNLSGGIELSHVSFRYGQNGPDIIRDLSMKIRAGQYVGIVGKTGCGKSTLLRLLLGFEKPRKGAVYYDRKELRKLNLTSLRRNIGCVLQDGFLFDGDILSNITIAAPWLGIDDAWEAARVAGLEESIKELPMGMMTLVGEGGGVISGGQKQRLLIARAVVAKPKVLMFDEATSALDNLTQEKITEALGQMKCTRIVIAHRLSTIKDCDKIFVMDEGRIVEEGKYKALIKKDGIFADLVRRQQINM